MKDRILEMEKSLFKYETLSDIDYLNSIFDDEFIEIGKSGKRFTKKDEITTLSQLKEDRLIQIYNYEYKQIDGKTFLIHYLTKSENNYIYRTSIWVNRDNKLKLLFHQASRFMEKVELTEY